MRCAAARRDLAPRARSTSQRPLRCQLALLSMIEASRRRQDFKCNAINVSSAFSVSFLPRYIHQQVQHTNQKKRRLPESEDLMRPSNAKRTVENDGQVQRQQGAVASFLSLEAHRFVLASDDKKATVSPDGRTIRLRSLDQWLNQGRRSRSVLRHRHRHLPATT